MVDIFTPVIERLIELGFFKFLLPYILMSAIIYGLLRKARVFGEPDENVAVNGVVAIVASLMVFAAPIVVGIDIETQLAAFFIQSAVVFVVLMIALLFTGMFLPPNLTQYLADNLFKGNKAGAILIFGIVLAFIIFATSGLWSSILPPNLFEKMSDLSAAVIMIILLVVPIIFITWGGGEKAPSPEPKIEEKP